jgi:hypothetical protein
VGIKCRPLGYERTKSSRKPGKRNASMQGMKKKIYRKEKHKIATTEIRAGKENPDKRIASPGKNVIK